MEASMTATKKKPVIALVFIRQKIVLPLIKAAALKFVFDNNL